jgi:hypothetical protein
MLSDDHPAGSSSVVRRNYTLAHHHLPRLMLPVSGESAPPPKPAINPGRPPCGVDGPPQPPIPTRSRQSEQLNWVAGPRPARRSQQDRGRGGSPRSTGACRAGERADGRRAGGGRAARPLARCDPRHGSTGPRVACGKRNTRAHACCTQNSFHLRPLRLLHEPSPPFVSIPTFPSSPHI